MSNTVQRQPPPNPETYEVRVLQQFDIQVACLTIMKQFVMVSAEKRAVTEPVKRRNKRAKVAPVLPVPPAALVVQPSPPVDPGRRTNWYFLEKAKEGERLICPTFSCPYLQTPHYREVSLGRWGRICSS